MENKIARYTANELAKVKNIKLEPAQIAEIVKRTPPRHIYKRQGPRMKNGKNLELDYVKGVFIKKKLNFIFGWEWSFEVIENKFDLEVNQAYCLGRLTVPLNDGTKIIKMQFGGAAIKMLSNGKPMNIANDLKAAATDALKKCASELGIASDVYQPEEYQEIEILQNDAFTLERVQQLYNEYGQYLAQEDQLYVQRIIEEKEQSSYKKAVNALLQIKDNAEKHATNE